MKVSIRVSQVMNQSHLTRESSLQSLCVGAPGGERGAPSCRSSCVSTHWACEGCSCCDEPRTCCLSHSVDDPLNHCVQASAAVPWLLEARTDFPEFQPLDSSSCGQRA